MSLIFGVWRYEKDTNLTNAIQQMYGATESLSFKKYHFKVIRDIAFGQALSYNTPQSIYEPSPSYLPNEEIAFVWQGRIDNREELSRLLSVKINVQYPDGSLLMNAYLKWGKNCVNHIRGDWSFAVFDFREQELFIARDPMGYTAIYYFQNESGFYFGSSIKNLTSLPTYNKQLNELYLVQCLTCWDDSKMDHDTYYKDIYLLPIAHTLTVRGSRIKISKYWFPKNTTLRLYKKKEEYSYEMLEIFSSAVERRLRSLGSVASMLSGGLDSSTVSFIAAELLKKSGIPLLTYSHVPQFINELKNDIESKRRVLDETPLMKSVADASGNILPNFLNSCNYSILNGMRDSIEIIDAPSHGASNLYWLLDIFKTASGNGIGSLLTGEGGNANISFAGIDYLRPLKLKHFLLHPYKSLRNQVAKPIAKNYFNSVLNRNKNFETSLEYYVNTIFAQPSILAKYDIVNDIRKNNKEVNKYYRDVNDLKDLFIALYNPRAVFGAACSLHYGFELRDPTTDVDVVEYFFSIPNEVFFDDHYNNRMLVKRMMRGKIPDSVLFEKKKGLQSADISYRVKAQAAELTAAIEGVKRSPAANHYIDLKKLSETWNIYLQQDYVEPYQYQRLLKALQFALFLQMNFD